MKKDERRPAPPPSATAPTDSVSFEAAMERLTRIVEQLESGELPLEQSLRLFEEGVALSRRASDLLGQAERKVEILTRSQDGTMSSVEFEDASDGEE